MAYCSSLMCASGEAAWLIPGSRRVARLNAMRALFMIFLKVDG
ncbi:hypothetical protein APX70_200574 [Pseudomonas syringae pv. maculicola]|uniref:Uncharacterized protein n=1 Tax=Pseudomonas syringae pv. maculicola TaxID=59511 RepID=A0A3M2YAD2_PSEYM|nr:hypothetical protein APX70_200574 [Pseudomonas syringae pv. maculicola]